MAEAQQQQHEKNLIPEEVDEAWSKEKDLSFEQRLNSAFEKIPISEFPNHRASHVVEINSDANIRDAVRTLAEHHLLSIPVVDKNASEEASWIDRYLGLVECAAIVLWVLSKSEVAATGIVAAATGTGATTGALIGAVAALAIGAPPVGMVAAAALASVGAGTAGGLGVSINGPGGSGPKAAASMGGEFFEALTVSEFYVNTKVKDIVGSFRWGPFLPVQPSDSMLTLLLLLSKYRMKSLPVVESGERQIKGMITQIDVIHMLSQCSGFSWFDSVGKKTLQELSLPVMKPKDVVKVKEDEPVLEAFHKIKERGLSGIPIISSKDENVLVGNISTRDVLILLTAPEVFKRYKTTLTVGNFLEAAREHLQEQGSDSPFAKAPVACLSTDTLKDVIIKLSQSSIHRIYVVGEEGDLQGVVTLRDIISKFVVEPDGYFGDFFQRVVPQRDATSPR